MSRFQKLREQYAAFYDRILRYREENERFAALVLNGFAEYLEIPKDYRDPFTSKPEPYIRLYRESDDGEFQEAEEVHTFRQAIVYKENDSFSLSFGVMLERKQNEFPKQVFSLRMHCERVRGKVHVTIGESVADCTYDGQNADGIEKVYEMIYGHLKKFLSSQPSKDERPPRMGFKPFDDN